MSSGARNWPFLMFTGLPARATAWMKSVCRHRNAGVCSTSTTATAALDFVHRVHVGEHRHVDLPADLVEDAQALLHARTAKRRVRTAVGLVVRRLEDERNCERRADRLQLAGDIHLQLPRFDDARTGDQEQRPVQPDVVAAQDHRRHRRIAQRPGGGRPAETSQASMRYATSLATARGAASFARCCCSSAAFTKLMKSGWPRRGLDVNSGWNWQPKNHGWLGSSIISTKSPAVALLARAPTDSPAASMRGR